MSIRQMAKVRGGAAVAVASVMALALAGCGGGEQPKDSQKPAASQSQGAASQKPAPQASNSGAATEVIATSQGASGIVLEINSAARDQDGYLTVNGQIKNTGSIPSGTRHRGAETRRPQAPHRSPEPPLSTTRARSGTTS